MYLLYQTLPQVCNCPLLTLYMSCGECVVRSLPKVLVFLSGDPWLWDWILSCVLEESVSGHLRIPFVASCSSSPSPWAHSPLPYRERENRRAKSWYPGHLKCVFSYYRAIWQFYNCTVFWRVIVSFPRNNPLWVFISVSLLLLFICLFVCGNQVSLYKTLRELTI